MGLLNAGFMSMSLSVSVCTYLCFKVFLLHNRIVDNLFHPLPRHLQIIDGSSGRARYMGLLNVG